MNGNGKITLPISLNPGLKAWGLTTMNSLRKSLEENNINKVKNGKKVKVIRNKNKITKTVEKLDEDKSSKLSVSLENTYDYKNMKNSNYMSFYHNVLFPNEYFDKIMGKIKE